MVAEITEPKRIEYASISHVDFARLITQELSRILYEFTISDVMIQRCDFNGKLGLIEPKFRVVGTASPKNMNDMDSDFEVEFNPNARAKPEDIEAMINDIAKAVRGESKDATIII